MDQVKKGIYKSSLDKWKKYEFMLEPAKKYLLDHEIPLTGVNHL